MLCPASSPCFAQACGQEQECLDLYKSLEATHPSAQIKKQAANLRFILEAPRLKLRPDERVSVPVLETDGRYACAACSFALYHNNTLAAFAPCPPCWPPRYAAQACARAACDLKVCFGRTP